jgi:hypothetical protein
MQVQTPIYPWMRETKNSRAQYSSHTYQQVSKTLNLYSLFATKSISFTNKKIVLYVKKQAEILQID